MKISRVIDEGNLKIGEKFQVINSKYPCDHDNILSPHKLTISLKYPEIAKIHKTRFSPKTQSRDVKSSYLNRFNAQLDA